MRKRLISVVSPEYLSHVRGLISIRLHADESVKIITARCVKATDGRFEDCVAASLVPENGECGFTFDCSEYPRGPMTIRFACDCDAENLQLYNDDGIFVEAGLKSAPIPVGAEAMKIVYADDFDSPLSISNKGGSRYYSHKPGGGDFSKIPFSDFESDKNPFSQLDSFLCIRADANKNSTGLISCVQPDGSGFEASAPCYFECRFIAPNAVGTWPAFWLLTNHVKRGNAIPVDELDTIEAYGLDDLGHQNQTGYYVTSHRWNQDRHETTDPDKFQDMRKIGNGLNWDACFHTFGTLINERDTVYYCDDIEVLRHPTQPASKLYPFYFMINLAVGGNGWPVDLSRYNGKVEMFVDFVRVWARQ